MNKLSVKIKHIIFVSGILFCLPSLASQANETDLDDLTMSDEEQALQSAELVEISAKKKAEKEVSCQSLALVGHVSGFRLPLQVLKEIALELSLKPNYIPFRQRQKINPSKPQPNQPKIKAGTPAPPQQRKQTTRKVLPPVPLFDAGTDHKMK